MKFMIPLGLVYLFEYFINQGTVRLYTIKSVTLVNMIEFQFELINFENIFLDHSSQYHWLQVDYQIGVFISRSSVNIFHIKQIWIMAVLQVFIIYCFRHNTQIMQYILQLINVVIFTTEVVFYYIPTFWIILALTLWEGLLGGAAYVNTFYKISSEVCLYLYAYPVGLILKTFFSTGTRREQTVFISNDEFCRYNRYYNRRNFSDSCPQQHLQLTKARAIVILICIVVI